MATCAALLPLAAILLLCSVHTAQAIRENERSFPMIRSSGSPPRQWLLRMERGNKVSGVYTRVNCTSPNLDACTDRYPPLWQFQGDVVRLTYTLNVTAVKTINNEVPTRMEARLCYSAPSFKDRPWRKKNKPFPRLSQNCPRKAGSFDFVGPANPVDQAANSHVFVADFDVYDKVPTATMFPMLWVYCGEEVCAFESAEGNSTATPPVSGNFVQTESITGITTGMRISAIILSALAPTLFLGYWIIDSMHYRKTGLPLVW